MEADAAGIELFRSANLLARAVGRGRGDTCVITFACLLDAPGLDVPGFGEPFFRSRGIDAVHVTCAGNDWYQYADLFAMLDAVRAAVRPYRRVLAYGSSMGGYAAVRYGGRAGAHEALAISPQFSIDARRVPFERRWRDIASSLVFLHEDAPITVPVATLVYDPRHADRRHADLFAEALTVRRIPLIHAGHPAGAYLAETGLLPELVLALGEGCVPADFVRRAREARGRSGQYLFTLSRSVAVRRAGTKLLLARRAVDAHPREPAYSSYLGLLLDHARDAAAAEEAHRRAVTLSPCNAIVIGRLARFLVRRGRIVEAAAWSQAAFALAPRDRRLRQLRAFTLLALGDAWGAARLLLAAPTRAGLLVGLVRDGMYAVQWRADPPGWRRRWSTGRTDRLPLRLASPDAVESMMPRRER